MKRFILFCFLFITADITQAQIKNLTGLVVDGGPPVTPLPGAIIIIPGSGVHTTTDQYGRFTLSTDSTFSGVLEVRYIGYKKLQIDLKTITDPSGNLGLVYLERDPFTFEDVIITTSPSGRASNYQPARSYSQEHLQRMSSSSFGEMLNGEPGVHMRSFGSAPSRPVIRGLDGDRVLILENGERMGDLAETAADHAITLDPLSAGRIEVVRGPASLLYGSSALGGVINLFNDDIPDGWTDGISGSAALQGATVNNELAGFGRLVNGSGRGAFTSRLNYRTSGDIRTPDERLTGTYNDHLSGSAGYTYLHGQNSYTGFSLTGLTTTYGLPDALDIPEQLVEIRMQRHTLRGRGQYYLDGLFNRADLRLNANWYNHKEMDLTFVPGDTFRENLELEFLTRSANGTLLIHHGDRQNTLRGTIGLNAGYREMRVGGNEALTPDIRSFILAALLFEEYQISPAFNIQTGFRTEYHYMKPVSNRDFKVTDFPQRSTWVSSASAGINWRPTKLLEAGFQVARAYRLPRAEELYSDAPHLGAGAYETGNPDLKNEIGIGTDLFIRYRNEHLFGEAALFFNSIRYFVTYSPAGHIHEPSGLPVFTYISENAEIIGGEFNVALRSQKMTYALGLDYVHGSKTGNFREPLPFMPPLRVRIGISYETTHWFAGTSLKLAHRQNRVADGEDVTEGFAVLTIDGGIRITDDNRHLLTFRLGNALNTRYRDHLTRIEDRNKPMPGRGLTLTWRFAI